MSFSSGTRIEVDDSVCVRKPAGTSNVGAASGGAGADDVEATGAGSRADGGADAPTALAAVDAAGALTASAITASAVWSAAAIAVAGVHAVDGANARKVSREHALREA